MRYTGWDLYNRVNNVVKTAFYKTFIQTDKTYCWVNGIHMNYRSIEDAYDTPGITVEIGYSHLGKNHYLDVDFRLNESDEFNAGYINSCIEAYDDKE